MRRRNVSVRDKAEKFLDSKPVYMMPHKNAVIKAQQNPQKKFRPKVMVGDLHKANCEFISDLAVLAH